MQGNRAAKQRESPASQENIYEERERKNIRKIRRRCRENATEGSGSPASQLDVTRFHDEIYFERETEEQTKKEARRPLFPIL